MNRLANSSPQKESEAGRTLYLASRSPRRTQLLAEAGIEVKTIESGVDDGVLNPGDVSVEQWATALAYFKAKAGAIRLEADGITGLVLGADTIVEHRGELMGKPHNRQDAQAMMTRLADAVHDVITGVAVVDLQSGERSLLCDRATVSVGVISQQDIQKYVDSDVWVGKAGGYNLSERLEAGWPIQFDGDPTTIMGLPMNKLTPHLHSRWGITTKSKQRI